MRRCLSLLCRCFILANIWILSWWTCGRFWNAAAHKNLSFEENRSIEDIIEEKNEERRQRIKTVCGQKKYSIQNMDHTNIIVDEKYKVIYCYVPKVACTQWKSVFAALKGFIPKPGQSVHYPPKGTFKYLRSYPVEERSKILQDYYTFLFVRDPMERLLSAYKEKFSESANDKDFKKNWSKHIIPFLIEQNPLRKDYNISFEDFLGFVGSNKVRQEHWELSYKLCQPCAIDYDFIGHFENLEDEAPYVLQTSGLNNTASFPAYRPSNTTSQLLRFYSQVPENLIVKVANSYQRDFELFGYPFPGPLTEIVQNIIFGQTN